MPILKCKNLSFSYEGKTVLEDINFEVEPEDYLAVVGENGAGKSTLIKGLLGLLKPSKGKIILGSKVSKNEIGYLPQSTEIKGDFPASVYEIVLSGCLNKMGFKPFFTKKEKKLVAENLSLLSIENLKHKCFRELSGGQKQRVLLARALSATKKILVLDEPTVGLDENAKASFYSLINKLNKEEHITIIMIIHDIEKAKIYSNKILHINKKLIFFGKTKDYIANN